MNPTCDIFCRVIDNFGDAAVCWRLARQLRDEHDLAVTLWIDDPATLARLAPGLDPALPHQRVADICVRRWAGEPEASRPGDLVIEGFGCRLPGSFLAAMRARPVPPFWINLEYLSAEDWVEGCHALPSVNPANGLTQYFWFPGFTTRTGGLLRESGLLAARQRFQAGASAQAGFWQELGLPEAVERPLRVSLFAYENPAIGGLLEAMADGDTPALAILPEGRALTEAARWAGSPLRAGDRLDRGRLRLAVLPFLTSGQYDRLLWACGLNAVRGEDSFVRAQWAGRPLLWHIYPQEDDAHWVKLEAFIHKAALPAPWGEAMLAWNGGATGSHAWADLLAALPRLQPASEAWAARLAAQTDLASGLMHFYRSRVE